MDSVDELADLITRELETYIEEVQESIDIACDMVTKQLVADIKEDSPIGATVNYAKGWTRKKLKYSRVVYNNKCGWRTHLLEFGHAKRGGGRVAARPHIFKNAERAKSNFEDMCVKIVAEGVRFK